MRTRLFTTLLRRRHPPALVLISPTSHHPTVITTHLKTLLQLTTHTMGQPHPQQILFHPVIHRLTGHQLTYRDKCLATPEWSKPNTLALMTHRPSGWRSATQSRSPKWTSTDSGRASLTESAGSFHSHMWRSFKRTPQNLQTRHPMTRDDHRSCNLFITAFLTAILPTAAFIWRFNVPVNSVSFSSLEAS